MRRSRPNGDRLEVLECFVTVAQRSSFSSAAKALRVDTATVSRRIARLESSLGTRLMGRNSRTVTLTEAGRLYLSRAQEILERLEAADAEVSLLSREPSGLLRVTAPTSFGRLHIAPSLGEFLLEHPGIRVDLQLTNRYSSLLDGGFDLAVRIGHLPDSDFVARRLAAHRRVLCASPKYFKGRKLPHAPEELIHHQLLEFTEATAAGEWQLASAWGEVAVPLTPIVKSNNADVLKEAALSGLGIALLGTFLVGAELRSGKLAEVLVGWEPVPRTEVYALMPSRRHLPGKTRAFVEFLSRRFGGVAPWDR